MIKILDLLGHFIDECVWTWSRVQLQYFNRSAELAFENATDLTVNLTGMKELKLVSHRISGSRLR